MTTSLLKTISGNSGAIPVPVTLSSIPSLYAESKRQGVAGLVGQTIVEPLSSTRKTGEYRLIYYQWMADVVQIEERNNRQNALAAELTEMFADAGMRTCVLKGQGAAQLYPEPSRRETGDIDLWVDADRETVLRFLRGRWTIGRPCIHHVDVKIFPDVPVEVHWMPAWLYNPIANGRLQKFFRSEAEAQFSNMSPLGFAYPTIRFNLVYMVIHIYKHTFYGNLLLKQLVDYFYVLKHSTPEERQEAMEFLSSLGLSQFIAYLMWRLSTELDLEEEYLLCRPDSRCCQPLQEAVCVFPWRVAHWGWRLVKGYL